MVDVKYDKSCHAGATPEARITSRQKNSGEGAKPNVTVKTGDSDRRTYHNIHNAGHYIQPGTLPGKGEGE